MKREANQRDRILALLQQAGERGVSNLLLNEVCFRYGARLWELRKEGWDIDTVKVGDDGVYRFVLKGKREPEQLKLIA